MTAVHKFFSFFSGPLFDATLLSTIVFPYVLYAVTYLSPATTRRLMSQRTLIWLSTRLKEVSIALYLIDGFRGGVDWSGVLIGASCALIGQFLSLIVIFKLGTVKLFYGWELEIVNERRLTEFPFLVGHPQYKGLILSVFGCWCAFRPTIRFTIATTVWIAGYFFLIVVESFESGRPKNKPQM
jgi:hypothetical protein